MEGLCRWLEMCRMFFSEAPFPTVCTRGCPITLKDGSKFTTSYSIRLIAHHNNPRCLPTTIALLLSRSKGPPYLFSLISMSLSMSLKDFACLSVRLSVCMFVSKWVCLHINQWVGLSVCLQLTSYTTWIYNAAAFHQTSHPDTHSTSSPPIRRSPIQRHSRPTETSIYACSCPVHQSGYTIAGRLSLKTTKQFVPAVGVRSPN